MSEEKRTDALPSDDALGTAINKILANPQLISMVASALGKSPPSGEAITVSADAPSSDTPPAEPPAAQDSTANVSGGDDMIATLMPMLSSLSKSGIGGIGGQSKDGGKSHHEQLLCALKPYVSPSRREAIDYILRISRMSGLISHLR